MLHIMRVHPHIYIPPTCRALSTSDNPPGPPQPLQAPGRSDRPRPRSRLRHLRDTRPQLRTGFDRRRDAPLLRIHRILRRPLRIGKVGIRGHDRPVRQGQPGLLLLRHGRRRPHRADAHVRRIGRDSRRVARVVERREDVGNAVVRDVDDPPPPPPRRRPIGSSRGTWGTSTSWTSSGIRPAPSPV